MLQLIELLGTLLEELAGEAAAADAAAGAGAVDD